MGIPINYTQICITCGAKDNVLVELVRYRQTGKPHTEKRGWVCHECSYQLRNYGHPITDEEWAIMVADDLKRQSKGGVNA